MSSQQFPRLQDQASGLCLAETLNPSKIRKQKTFPFGELDILATIQLLKLSPAAFVPAGIASILETVSSSLKRIHSAPTSFPFQSHSVHKIE
jgi:hypothetical protein